MDAEGSGIVALLSDLRFSPGGREEAKAERHLALLETLAGMDGVSVALYDLAERRYRFLRTSIGPELGLARADSAPSSLEFYADLLHPDDRSPYFETSAAVLRYIMERPPSERRDYRTYIDFRISAGQGVWRRLAIQNSVLETDLEGMPWLVLSVVEPSPFRDPDLPIRRSLKRKSTGDFVLFPERERRAAPAISPREAEILCLVSKGYSSPDIADLLSLSVHTVNTHRRNAMGKLDAQNSAEAVRYAAERGLI